ncbi:MAG: hypothetical protein PHC34_11055 [Candidatus Gastranaerophilales bacterium]|nr:hypothetical protein [Candidatus Gastranaerophilales bacterium]
MPEELGTNMQRLIKLYRITGNALKVDECATNIENLNNGEGYNPELSFDDLMYVANYHFDNADYNRAIELFDKAKKIEESRSKESLNYAKVLINLGRSELRKDNTLKGIKLTEEANTVLENIIDSKKEKADESRNLLYQSYNMLGDVYYSRNNFENAALAWKKSCGLLDKMPNIPKDEKSSILSRTAAAFYKSGKYDYCAKYNINYLSSLLDKDFKYEQANNDRFAEKILNKFEANECKRIATAFEMLGVANVRDKSYQAATLCFQTSYKIREKTSGNKIDTAKDLQALGRLAMLDDFGKSEILLKQSLNIMKNDLGKNHPDVKKEEDFIGKYFGLSLGSAGKHFWRFVDKHTPVNKFSEQIIDDFHYIYRDLGICE